MSGVGVWVAGISGWILAAAAAVALVACRRRLALAVELVARCSHEVRGPLGAAMLALGLMQRLDGAPSDRVAALDAQLRRARAALDELAGAPARGPLPDRLVPLDVADVLAAVAVAWEPVARAQGRDLRIDQPTEPATVLADADRIAQATGNLIANALEHGSGTVRVRARPLPTSVRLEVCDEGPGLSEPLQALVSGSRRRGERGRGLAITAGIAGRHGGRLTCAPSGTGAALVLELPALAVGEAGGLGAG